MFIIIKRCKLDARKEPIMRIQLSNTEKFFGYYLFHPLDQKLDTVQKVLAAVASTILAIGTLGIVHAICYFTLHGRVKKGMESATTATATQVGNQHLVAPGKPQSNPQIQRENNFIRNFLNDNTHPRKDYLLQFLLDDQAFVNDWDFNKHYDVGMEDIVGVSWLGGNYILANNDSEVQAAKAKDKIFLQNLEQKYPQQLAKFRAAISPNFLKQGNETRFANNDIALMLQHAKGDYQMMQVAKEILRHAVLRDRF